MNIGREASFLNVRRTEYNGMQAVKLVGPFDCLSDIALDYARQIIDEGHKEIVLDLSDVSYMTSQGIACIIKMLKLLQSDSFKLNIRGANKDMIDLIRLARVDNYLSFIS